MQRVHLILLKKINRQTFERLPIFYVRRLFLLFVLFLFLGFCFGLFLGILYLGVSLFLLALFLLMLGVVKAHAGHFMLDGHDGMAQQHAGLAGGHDLPELFVLGIAEAGHLAAVADGLGDAVGAAVHFRHDRCQQGRTFRTEPVAGGFMMAVAVNAKGLADVRFFLWDVILYFRLLSFW